MPVKRLRLLNPFRIKRVVADIRRVSGDGGPKRLHLKSIGHPEGWFFPTAAICLEVEGQNGARTSFEPVIPVPFPYAWAYRIARKLGVPLVSDIEPQRFAFSVRVPRRGGTSGS